MPPTPPEFGNDPMDVDTDNDYGAPVPALAPPLTSLPEALAQAASGVFLSVPLHQFVSSFSAINVLTYHPFLMFLSVFAL
jgi:hypothetical protein